MDIPIRIGIDGRALIGNRAGIGRYVYELCKQLDILMPEATFFVYSNHKFDLPVKNDRWILRTDNYTIFKKLKSLAWYKLRCGVLLKKDNIDLFWGASSFLPTIDKKIPTVTTVYDLNHILVPETMVYTQRLAFKLFLKNDISRSTYVAAISKGTSEKMFKYHFRAADNIIYPSTDLSFSPRGQCEIDSVLEKYNVISPYLLAVATWEPRKNLELLVDTFIKMKYDGLLPSYKLVLIGGRGWLDGRLAEKLASTSDVMPLGYVPDSQLPAIYSGARIFIFPSMYEGYGMPVAEACACGTPVIATDIQEIREAGNTNVSYIVADAASLRKSIMDIISQNSENHLALINENKKCWRTEASKLVYLFRNAVKNRSSVN